LSAKPTDGHRVVTDNTKQPREAKPPRNEGKPQKQYQHNRDHDLEKEYQADRAKHPEDYDAQYDGTHVPKQTTEVSRGSHSGPKKDRRQNDRREGG